MALAIDLQARAGPTRCVFCRDSLGDEDETWTCGKCGSNLHADCAQELRVCPSPGCGRSTRTRPARRRRRREGPRRARPQIRPRRTPEPEPEDDRQETVIAVAVAGATILLMLVFANMGSSSKAERATKAQKPAAARKQSPGTGRTLSMGADAKTWAQVALAPLGTGAVRAHNETVQANAVHALAAEYAKDRKNFELLVFLADVAARSRSKKTQADARAAFFKAAPGAELADLYALSRARLGQHWQLVHLPEPRQAGLRAFRRRALIYALDPRHSLSPVGRRDALKALEVLGLPDADEQAELVALIVHTMKRYPPDATLVRAITAFSLEQEVASELALLAHDPLLVVRLAVVRSAHKLKAPRHVMIPLYRAFSEDQNSKVRSDARNKLRLLGVSVP